MGGIHEGMGVVGQKKIRESRTGPPTAVEDLSGLTCGGREEEDGRKSIPVGGGGEEGGPPWY